MISAAMAVYNGQRYLKEQLDSIFAQSRPVDELVIVDDGSSDESMALLLEYRHAHPEVHMRILHMTANGGYKKAFAHALEHCGGDWILLCDQDDRWHADKVEKLMNKAESTLGMWAIASSFDYMNEDSEIFQVRLLDGWSNQNLYPHPVDAGATRFLSLEEFYFHNYFQGCSMMISRELKDEFLAKFTERIPHDWLLGMLAASHHGMCFYNVSLFDYRIHANNTIGVPDHSYKARLRHLFDETSRTLAARQALDALETAYEAGLIPPTSQQSLHRFLTDNLKAIDERDLSLLGTLKDSEWYVKIKGKSGYAADALFILSHPHIALPERSSGSRKKRKVRKKNHKDRKEKRKK